MRLGSDERFVLFAAVDSESQGTSAYQPPSLIRRADSDRARKVARKVQSLRSAGRLQHEVIRGLSFDLQPRAGSDAVGLEPLQQKRIPIRNTVHDEFPVLFEIR